MMSFLSCFVECFFVFCVRAANFEDERRALGVLNRNIDFSVSVRLGVCVFLTP